MNQQLVTIPQRDGKCVRCGHRHPLNNDPQNFTGKAACIAARVGLTALNLRAYLDAGYDHTELVEMRKVLGFLPAARGLPALT